MAGCRPLTRSEITKVLEAATPKIRLLALVGLTFGTRISEALKMTFGDIGDEWVTIKALKGGRIQEYEVPVAVEQAVSALKTVYEKKGITVTAATPLFMGYKGKAMTRQNASQQIKILFDQTGIKGKVNTHSFRKNFVTKIYGLTGKDLAQTRLYSRHKNMGSLQYYIETSMSTSLVKDLNW